MKINSLTISNFKNYQGLSPVDLETDGVDNNLVLIGGKNGYGKTTFCEAIKLCLFGKKLFGTPLSKREYSDYLKDVMNEKAKKNGEDKAFVNMEISLEETFGNFNLTIQREWNYNESNFIDDNLIILRDGSEFEYIPEEYWQDYLESLFPPYLSKFFIFDGEKVEEFATDPKFQDEIKKSLKDAVGLKTHETLYSDLSNLQSKIKRRNIEEEEIRDKIEKRNKDHEIKEEKLTEIDNKINNVEEKIDDLSDRKIELEEELDRVAGKITKDMDIKNDELESLKDNKDNLNQTISDISGSFLPFVIPNNISESLVSQLQQENKIKEKKSSKKFLDRINGKFSESLKTKLEIKDDFTKSDIKEIEGSVKETFNEFLSEEEMEDIIIHDLTKSESYKIQSFINRARRNVNNGFAEKVDKLKEIEENIKELKKELKKTTESKNVRELIDEISKVEKEKGSLEEKKKRLIDEKEDIKNQIDNISSNIKKLENEIVCAEVDRRKVDMINNIQKVIKCVEDNVISSRIEKLEKYMDDMYHRLSNKDDMVESVRINNNSYSVELFDNNGNKIKKSSISTGEKEIFAISVLNGLLKISDYNFPVIIDAPLTSLDEEHTNNILSKFIPNIGDQVILLSTDREIDEEKYKIIKDKISREFVLNEKGPQKIQEGYFFDQ